MVVPGGMVAVGHKFPADPVNDKQTGYYNLDMFLTIDVEPKGKSHYFWATQFFFHNGNGGYMGLQTGANMGGTEMKIAIFSIWDALDAKKGSVEGAEAGTFGGEGVGYQCKIPFDWKEDTQYRLRLFEVADARYPDQPEWWGAWVMDMETMDETQIGQIKVPADWGWMKGSSDFFVEYYLSTPSCEEIPHQKATLHSPTRENGQVRPTAITKAETYGTCARSASVHANLSDPSSDVKCSTGTVH